MKNLFLNILISSKKNIAIQRTRSDRYIYPILSRYESSDCSDLFSIIQKKEFPFFNIGEKPKDKVQRVIADRHATFRHRLPRFKRYWQSVKRLTGETFGVRLTGYVVAMKRNVSINEKYPVVHVYGTRGEPSNGYPALHELQGLINKERSPRTSVLLRLAFVVSVYERSSIYDWLPCRNFLREYRNSRDAAGEILAAIAI